MSKVAVYKSETRFSLKSGETRFTDGGDKGSRTPDLLNAIEALYQLSYIPIREREILSHINGLLSTGNFSKFSSGVAGVSHTVSVDRYAEKMIYSTQSLVLDLCDLRVNYTINH